MGGSHGTALNCTELHRCSSFCVAFVLNCSQCTINQCAENEAILIRGECLVTMTLEEYDKDKTVHHVYLLNMLAWLPPK